MYAAPRCFQSRGVTARRGGRSAAQPCRAIKLYTNPGSRGKITEWYLTELGQPFETVTLDMRAGQHKTPEYLAVNPFGKVPGLVDGDLKIFESGAIILHLANKYGKLDEAKFAKACQWTLFANSTMCEAFFQNGQSAMPGVLSVLDSMLSSKPYLEGEEMSVGDIAVCAYLLYLPLFFPRLFVPGPKSVPAEYPNVWKYMQLMASRPSCPSAYSEAVQSAVAAFGAAPSGGGGGGILGGIFGKK